MDYPAGAAVFRPPRETRRHGRRGCDRAGGPAARLPRRADEVPPDQGRGAPGRRDRPSGLRGIEQDVHHADRPGGYPGPRHRARQCPRHDRGRLESDRPLRNRSSDRGDGSARKRDQGRDAAPEGGRWDDPQHEAGQRGRADRHRGPPPRERGRRPHEQCGRRALPSGGSRDDHQVQGDHGGPRTGHRPLRGRRQRAERHCGEESVSRRRSLAAGWRDARRHALGMADVFTILIVAILVVFLFDFFNGFHDAANAIATIVATKVLTPTKAVAMAAAGNFVGMVFITNAIAETIGKGIIDTNVLGMNALPLSPGAFFHSLAFIMGGVVGAIVWDLITWLSRLPTAISHALIGGIIGAAALAAGPGSILLPSTTNMLLFVFVTGMAFVLGAASFFGYDVIIRRHPPTLGTTILARLRAGLLPAVILGKILLKGLVQIVVYMVAAPLVGLVFAFGLALVVIRLFHRHTPTKVNHEFKRLQLVSSFFYSVTHGTNDAQQGMGICTLILVVAAIGPPWGPPSGQFAVPFWVIVGAHASISLGTLFGGWRIVRTMSQRVTHLRPWQGFSAETGGGIALASSALAGIPVSTTHVIASAIMGVGATKRLSAVRWGVARRVFWAWIVTLPASAGGGMAADAIMRIAFGV